MTREFVVETDLDLTAVVEFEGIGQKFKPHEEIVRCKDCKYNYANIKRNKYEIYKMADGSDASEGIDIVCTYFETDGQYPNEFCSHAKKVGDEDE